jgi:hypothetical protein
MPADEGVLPADIIGRLSAHMRLPLTPERVGELAGPVEGMLAFTGELDRLAMDDAAPAAVFVPLDG